MERMAPEVTHRVDAAICDVVTRAASSGQLGDAARAVFALFRRVAGSWNSLCALADCENDEHFKTRSFDCAAILRCMYDAFLQAKYIIQEPNKREERGKLYLDYEHIERYKIANLVVAQDNRLAKIVADSPRRAAGEARNRELYKKLESKYKNTQHWYEGNLRDLAKAVGERDEYVWFVSRYNSAIHSGPFATLGGPGLSDGRQVETIASWIVGRAAKALVDTALLKVHPETDELLCALDKSILNIE